MNRTEAIEILENGDFWDLCVVPYVDSNKPAMEFLAALDMAIATLRAQQEPNDPLTLEQLRKMAGEPIYLDLGDGSGWVLLSVQQGKVFVTHKNTICAPVNILFERGGRAYRHRPEEGRT